MGCPNCGSANASPIRAWTRGSGKGEMRVEHHICSRGQGFQSWKDPRTGKMKVITGKDAKE